jgi:hypothetical protein
MAKWKGSKSKGRTSVESNCRVGLKVGAVGDELLLHVDVFEFSLGFSVSRGVSIVARWLATATRRRGAATTGRARGKSGDVVGHAPREVVQLFIRGLVVQTEDARWAKETLESEGHIAHVAALS